MTAGLVLAGENKLDYLNVEFPYIMKQMGQAKMRNKTRNGVSAKLGKYAHLASAQSTMELLPYFMTLYRRDADFRTEMTKKLKLNEKEINYLMGDHAELEEITRLLALVTDETEKIPAALMGKSRRKREEKVTEAKKEEKTPAAVKNERKEKGPEKGKEKKEKPKEEVKGDKNEEKGKKAKVLSLTDF